MEFEYEIFMRELKSGQIMIHSFDATEEEHSEWVADAAQLSPLLLCQRFYEWLSDRGMLIPAIEAEWLKCDSDVADQYRLKTTLTLGEWGPWEDMPADLKGKPTYPAFCELVDHRCRNVR